MIWLTLFVNYLKWTFISKKGVAEKKKRGKEKNYIDSDDVDNDYNSDDEMFVAFSYRLYCEITMRITWTFLEIEKKLLFIQEDRHSKAKKTPREGK